LKIGAENDIFWSTKGSGFGEQRAHPHQEFPGVPPPVLCEERLLPLPELSRKIEGPVREGYSSRERTVEAKLYPFQPPASSYHTL